MKKLLSSSVVQLIVLFIAAGIGVAAFAPVDDVKWVRTEMSEGCWVNDKMVNGKAVEFYLYNKDDMPIMHEFWKSGRLHTERFDPETGEVISREISDRRE